MGVGVTLLGVYILSGLCSALEGVLLTGFSGQASLGMGNEHLLRSIAVVVVGGTLITGRRALRHAVRDIIFGSVLLGSILVLRGRSR